jgi:hypothetical protein
LDGDFYTCPCGGCIAGLKRQLHRLEEGQDDPWLRESLRLSRQARRKDPRFKGKDEKGRLIKKMEKHSASEPPDV